MGVTEKVGEFIETGDSGGPLKVRQNPAKVNGTTGGQCAGAPLQLLTVAAALWSTWVPAILDVARWKESTAVKGKPKLAAAAQAVAAAWAAEVGSIASLFARLSFARWFWNQIFT